MRGRLVLHEDPDVATTDEWDDVQESSVVVLDTSALLYWTLVTSDRAMAAFYARTVW